MMKITNSSIINHAVRTANGGTLFDMIDRSNCLLITDYHALKKEIILSENDMSLNLGEEKKRLQIDSIDGLKNALDGYISEVLQMFDSIFNLNCSNINRELLIDQLIFDIFFDKYQREAEEKTQYGYSSSEYLKKLTNYFEKEEDSFQDATRNSIKRGMKKHSDMIKHSPLLQEELVELGIKPDEYIKYFSPKAADNSKKKKPRYAWNLIYCNQYMITSRQYRRQIKEDGNYSSETFIGELRDYDAFVKSMLPVEDELPREYFEKSMDYYFLESYKRIDFIFKLMDIIPKIEAANAEYTFLVKRFHPKVLVPYEKNNELDFTRKCNYYRPLLMIEDELHKLIQNNDEYDQSLYGVRLFNCQLVRAKVYELFRYHAEYTSSDYEDIKKFISERYNMLSYHQSNKIWSRLSASGQQWRKWDKETQAYFRTLKKNFISINETLFWDSPKRKPAISDE